MGPSVMQLNVEGLTRAKCEVIAEIARKHAIWVILLEETHSRIDNNINIFGFYLIAAIHDRHHGLATLTKDGIPSSLLALFQDSDLQWIAIKIDELTIVNVY